MMSLLQFFLGVVDGKTVVEEPPAKAPVLVSPVDDHTSIGNILIEMGAIDRDQLQQALLIQHMDSGDIMLGAILTNCGFCSVRDITCALAVQEKRRNNEPAAAAMVILEAKTEEMKANTRILAAAVSDMTGRKTALSMAKVG